jgi:hypothetical protein
MWIVTCVTVSAYTSHCYYRMHFWPSVEMYLKVCKVTYFDIIWEQIAHSLTHGGHLGVEIFGNKHFRLYSVSKSL